MRSICTFVVLAVATSTAAFAAPEKFTLAKDHGQVLFAVDHFGFSKTHGWFSDLDGTLLWDAKDSLNSKVDMTIKAASINTAHADRDKDLQGADFLDAAKYPNIHFVSTKVTRVDAKTLQVSGDLSLHGQTKPATLTATLNKSDANPFSKAPTVGFSGTLAVKRSDFGIKTYLPGIGDEVVLTFDVEFNLAK